MPGWRTLPEEGLNLGDPFTYKHQLDSLFNITLPQSDRAKKRDRTLLTSCISSLLKRYGGGLEESASQKVNWLMPRKKLSYTALLDSMIKPGTARRV